MDQLKTLPYDDLGFAKIDTHRSMRRGFPEVIYCEGKTTKQVQAIVNKMKDQNKVILGMRASTEVYKAVKEITGSVHTEYHEEARALIVGKKPEVRTRNKILIISAGTADIPVAEEAAITARFMGNEVKTLFDVGVSGLHRLLENMETIMEASVIVVVAGMEGALPSIVGGLVDKPVVAVPTSAGYGASFEGISALLGMLNSCASGVTVVNIDNGFGAGYAASLINRL